MLYIWWTILWFLTFSFRQSTKRWQNRQGVPATAPDERYNEDDKRRSEESHPRQQRHHWRLKTVWTNRHQVNW